MTNAFFLAACGLFVDRPYELYPFMIVDGEMGAAMEANFGQRSFLYDLGNECTCGAM